MLKAKSNMSQITKLMLTAAGIEPASRFYSNLQILGSCLLPAPEHGASLLALFRWRESSSQTD